MAIRCRRKMPQLARTGAKWICLRAAKRRLSKFSPIAPFAFSRQDFSTPRRPASKRPRRSQFGVPLLSFFFFTSLLHYFFSSYFLSLRTVLPQEPRNAIAEIFIQFPAYY
jgi:hypothetical protein